MAERIDGAINRIEGIVKHGKLKLKRKILKKSILKPVTDKIPDKERDSICKEARKTAHSTISDFKRDLSNKVKKDLGNYI